MTATFALVQEGEAKYLRGYPGFRCQVPIKWALNELRTICESEDKDRMAFMSRNYEALQVWECAPVTSPNPSGANNRTWGNTSMCVVVVHMVDLVPSIYLDACAKLPT